MKFFLTMKTNYLTLFKINLHYILKCLKINSVEI